MRRPLAYLTLALSGSGFPLTQLVIRRFGWTGAVLVEGVAAGLLVRDAAMIAGGALGRLEPLPAGLLRFETATAGVAVAAGALLLCDRSVRAARAPDWRVPKRELVRRLAVAALFGFHTARFRIYLAPGSGRRQLMSEVGAPAVGG
jgi:hypothetical protein